jgi:hypothetical protein
MNINRKRWIVLGLILVVAIFAGLALFYLSPRDPFFRSRAFSSEKWLKGNSRVRGQMARDLTASKLLDGKTHAQVEALLGPPDWPGTNELYYRIDVGYRFMGRPWWYKLQIRFDETSNTVQYAGLGD